MHATTVLTTLLAVANAALAIPSLPRMVPPQSKALKARRVVAREEDYCDEESPVSRVKDWTVSIETTYKDDQNTLELKIDRNYKGTSDDITQCKFFYKPTKADKPEQTSILNDDSARNCDGKFAVSLDWSVIYEDSGKGFSGIWIIDWNDEQKTGKKSKAEHSEAVFIGYGDSQIEEGVYRSTRPHQVIIF